MIRDLNWRAQRHGQDWRDEAALGAIAWLTSLVPAQTWAAREAAAAARFEAARQRWAEGDRVSVVDSEDLIAWYVLQARYYSTPELRPNWFEPEGYRIAPLFRRLGQLMPTFESIEGAEERAARIMTHGRNQPDDGLYELLVAAAYKRRGWSKVEFVPEQQGIGKTPDLLASKRARQLAVECKRGGRSGYAQEEYDAAERMAAEVHEYSRATGRSVIVLANFLTELTAAPRNYLAEKVADLPPPPTRQSWRDDIGEGLAGDVDWDLLRSVLRHDDIYFGASRMAELLIGGNPAAFDVSISGDWRPAEGRPFHADSVDRVSLVGWISGSDAAARRKASHFRSVVARATEQLPNDGPGVIHVGYEATRGNAEDGLRHRLNREQMRTFDPRDCDLIGVYGNYWMPEHVTARNESAAISETTAWYPVGKPPRTEPLPGGLLFMDEAGEPGAHFPR